MTLVADLAVTMQLGRSCLPDGFAQGLHRPAIRTHLGWPKPGPPREILLVTPARSDDAALPGRPVLARQFSSLANK